MHTPLVALFYHIKAKERRRKQHGAARPLQEDGNSIEISVQSDTVASDSETTTTASVASFTGEGGKPNPARSPYTFFTLDEHPRIMNEYPDITFARACKLLTERWHMLTPAERLRYDNLSQEDRRRFDRDMSRYINGQSSRGGTVPSDTSTAGKTTETSAYDSYYAHNNDESGASESTAASEIDPEYDPNAVYTQYALYNQMYGGSQECPSQEEVDNVCPRTQYHRTKRCLADQ